MENLCYYVNSRGILKSCIFRAKNIKSSSSENKLYLTFMLDNQFDKMSIYVCSELLSYFVDNILSKIKNTFTLVSGDSDLSVPIQALTNAQFLKLINSSFLLKWFIQNTIINNNPKIVQLPIGLDYHTISTNPKHQWKLCDEGHLPSAQENILVNLIQNSSPFSQRIPKIYVNFSKTTDRFGQRKECLEQIPNDLLIIYDKFIPRTHNWENILNYTFVVSPFGNGMDCHRTWEVLCLGSIPIVKAPFFSTLFEDLPVLIVNDWSDITEQLLNDTILLFENKNFNYDKLKLKYWTNQINNTN